MYIRNVRDLKLGKITTEAPGKASLNSLLEAVNVRVSHGSVVPRDGQKYLDEDMSVDGTIHSIYTYSRPYWDANNLRVAYHREYIFSWGTKLYAWEGVGDNTFYFINEDIPLSGDDVYLAVYGDWAYICNGIDPLYKYDAIHFWTAAIAAPAEAPEIDEELHDSLIGLPNPDSDEYPDWPYFDTSGFKRYKYRYIRKVEYSGIGSIDYFASEFSPVRVSVDFGMLNMNVAVVASADEQVTGIELYSTKVSPTERGTEGQPFYLIATLENETGVFYDTISTAAIEAYSDDDYTNLYPQEVVEDWTPPPSGLSLLVYYKERFYAVDKKANPATVLYSNIGYPTQWPEFNFLEIKRDDGDSITGFAVAGNTFYIFKNRSVWTMTGDPDQYPVIEAKVGGEQTAQQTEFGIGCTAPRSIASHGGDVYFYSKVYGAYKASGDQLVNISSNVGDISGLDDETAGAVYMDANNDTYYILSPPTGHAHVYHIDTGAWVNDSGINAPCFCIDHTGALLDGLDGRINRVFHPDYDTDNGDTIKCHIKTAWLNLRDNDMIALVRGLQVQTREVTDSITITAENEQEETYIATYERDVPSVGFDDLAGRLFSFTFDWVKGCIDSFTVYYRRRRQRR